LASWTPYSPSSRLKWKAIRFAHRSSLASLLPKVATVHLSGVDNADWRSLGWERRADPIPLIYVGSPGPHQKAVIHLLDETSCACHAIVKVPLCAGAKEAIIREAGVLYALAEEQYPFAPRLLHLDVVRGISTQQFLPGKSGTRNLRPEYLALTRSQVNTDQSTSLSEQAAFWHEEPLSSLTRASDLQLMGSALAELADAQSLPACWIHGDFAPWNIRQRANGPAALIDWEDAESCGLPLQDAFHFLHMQDFLFRARPAAHSEQLTLFAKSLGISPQQCRKLEIAYTARTWVNCTKQNHPRAAYLFSTLALLLRQRPGTSGLATQNSSRRLRLVSSHPAHVPSARAELFASVVDQLNQAGVPYCALSGYDSQPGDGGQDLDIMVGPGDAKRLPQLLVQAAANAGAILAQSIQHETTACYFVLARASGKHIGCLDVDCYSDYCRDGRVWMRADEVIANRRKHCNFFLPSGPDEFTYYLIKKVLKQSVSLNQLKRLQHMFACDPGEARQRLRAFWPAETAGRLQRAIADQRLNWLESNLPALLVELHRSAAVERPFRRALRKWHEAARFIRRIISPTGLSLLIVGANSELRSRVADGLASELGPILRHTHTIRTPRATLQTVWQAFEVWAARIRSTLVIRTLEEAPPVGRLPRAVHRLRSLLACRLAPCDILVQLSDSANSGTPTGRGHDRIIRIDASLSSEQIIHEASRAALLLLANRTAKRLRLPRTCESRVEDDNTSAILRSAGLD
jgi:hypothetical protein